MLRHSLLADLLHECQQTRDLAIICKDGQLTCNSFLFSAIFRGFNRIIVDSVGDTEFTECTRSVRVTVSAQLKLNVYKWRLSS